MGSDQIDPKTGYIYGKFQSTLPGWGATARYTVDEIREMISIHAPRMGSD